MQRKDEAGGDCRIVVGGALDCSCARAHCSALHLVNGRVENEGRRVVDKPLEAGDDGCVSHGVPHGEQGHDGADKHAKGRLWRDQGSYPGRIRRNGIGNVRGALCCVHACGVARCGEGVKEAPVCGDGGCDQIDDFLVARLYFANGVDEAVANGPVFGRDCRFLLWRLLVCFFFGSLVGVRLNPPDAPPARYGLCNHGVLEGLV